MNGLQMSLTKGMKGGMINSEIQASPKNWLKVCIFRIFCELLTKTGLGSRINTGFLRGYRRNGISPRKGIDTNRYFVACYTRLRR